MPLTIKSKRRLARISQAPVLNPVLSSMMRFTVRKWALELETLGGLDGLRIGIITDIHWGLPPMNARMLDAAKQRVMALSPDIIVFLGDLAGGFSKRQKARNVIRGAAQLAGLEAPMGLFAILGNHDWQDDPVAHAKGAGPVAAAVHLQKAGFTVLQNRAVPLAGDQKLYLAGLDSQRALKMKPWFLFRRKGVDDLHASLADVPEDAQVILLAHEPDVFPDIDDRRVMVTLSGHTHAGQIRVMGRPIATPSRHGTTYAYGHFENQGRHLIVSSGLGSSTIPLRVGTTPEVALVDLRVRRA